MSESLEEKEMLWELKAKGEFFFFFADLPSDLVSWRFSQKPR